MARAGKNYAVAVRDGHNLWLALRVNRGPVGDVYTNIPRTGKWNPHSSCHASGQQHHKSYNKKFAPSTYEQPPDASSVGSKMLENLLLDVVHPQAVNKRCVPTDYYHVFEIPASHLGTRKRTQLHVHLAASGLALDETMSGEIHVSRVLDQAVFGNSNPLIVATLFEISRIVEAITPTRGRGIDRVIVLLPRLTRREISGGTAVNLERSPGPQHWCALAARLARRLCTRPA